MLIFRTYHEARRLGLTRRQSLMAAFSFDHMVVAVVVAAVLVICLVDVVAVLVWR